MLDLTIDIVRGEKHYLGRESEALEDADEDARRMTSWHTLSFKTFFYYQSLCCSRTGTYVLEFQPASSSVWDGGSQEWSAIPFYVL